HSHRCKRKMLVSTQPPPQHIVQFGHGIAALFENLEQRRIMQGTYIELSGCSMRTVKLLHTVQIFLGERPIQSHAHSTPDGPSHPSKNHVTAANFLGGSSNFRTNLLIEPGV